MVISSLSIIIFLWAVNISGNLFFIRILLMVFYVLLISFSDFLIRNTLMGGWGMKETRQHHGRVIKTIFSVVAIEHSITIICAKMLSVQISMPLKAPWKTTLQKAIVFNLIMSEFIIEKKVTSPSCLTNGHSQNSKYHFCYWSHDRKWCHNLQIRNIIIVLKWTLMYRICARHLYW